MRPARHTGWVLPPFLACLVAALWGCGDPASNPESWTVDSLHKAVGLEGGHQLLRCADCHETGDLQAPVAPDCETCHLGIYATTTEPEHAAQGYSTACARCHDSRAWRPTFYDHAGFGFALEGAHRRTICAGCHPPGELFGPLPSECVACHAADTDGADPDHGALGFSRQCQTCHGTDDWRADAFDHEATGFALRGAHAAVDCAACHDQGYAGTPTDCAVCHADVEPRDHFGPDCAACHTEQAWEPSTFDHEAWFPLRGGAHRRYRGDCAACHLQPADYTVFTCTDCHDGKHERGRTDRKHDEVRGYRYASAACYDCHPRGREDDAEGGD